LAESQGSSIRTKKEETALDQLMLLKETEKKQTVAMSMPNLSIHPQHHNNKQLLKEGIVSTSLNTLFLYQIYVI
jgi:hypothetical protein